MRKGVFALTSLSLVAMLVGCAPSLSDLKSDKFIKKFSMPKEPGCHTGVWTPTQSESGGLHKTDQTKAGRDCRPMPDTDFPVCWPWVEPDGRVTGYYGEGCVDGRDDVLRVR
jgi:hypothetical protein